MISCRLCGASARRRLERVDLVLYACPVCGLVSSVPRSESRPEDRYRDYYRRPDPPPPTTRYAEWLAKAESRIPVGRRFLEVGAGSGALVRVALERGWSVDATEVSASGVAALRATGARVFEGDLEAARYEEDRFDFAAAIEVLEHLPSPAPLLHEIARVTRPGGLALVTTPNFKGLTGRLLGGRWRVVDPEHYCYFRPGVLRRAMLQAGFTDAEVQTRSIDVAGWRAGLRGGSAPQFDAVRSAALRDRVETTSLLRLAREAVNVALSHTGLGDTIVAWARK